MDLNRPLHKYLLRKPGEEWQAYMSRLGRQFRTFSTRAMSSIRREKYRFWNGRKNKRMLAESRRKLPISDEPLVSVRIATYQNSCQMIERTIPSVLNQTYQKFEIVIVGDGCSSEHVQRINKFLTDLNDPRIKFENLAERGRYPENILHRWYVAGVTPANRGIELCRGEWIAPLDDDDEFTPDHIESLVKFALEEGYEFVYSKALMESSDGTWTELGSYPLRPNQVCHLSVMYHQRLAFFRYDIKAWKYDEAGDRNMWRRMMEAGARVGFLPQVTGYHYKEGTRKGK